MAFSVLRPLSLIGLLISFVLVASPAAAGSARASSQGSPRVVDSTNQFVGSLLNVDRVLREIGGIFFALPAGVSGFRLEAAQLLNQFFYETSDGTGQAYLRPPSFARELWRTEALGVVYAGDPLLRVIRSADVPPQGCLNSLIFPDEFEVSLPLPFDKTVLDGLTPPFRILR